MNDTQLRLSYFIFLVCLHRGMLNIECLTKANMQGSRLWTLEVTYVTSCKCSRTKNEFANLILELLHCNNSFNHYIHWYNHSNDSQHYQLQCIEQNKFSFTLILSKQSIVSVINKYQYSLTINTANEYALAPLSINMIGSVWRKRRRTINCNRQKWKQPYSKKNSMGNG